MPCKIFRGTKVPVNEKSWERKFLGTKGPGNESSQELSFPGNESSGERKGPGTKVLGNESSRERKVSGTKVPHRDYSFLGTKGLVHEKSRCPDFCHETRPRPCKAETETFFETFKLQHCARTMNGDVQIKTLYKKLNRR